MRNINTDYRKLGQISGNWWKKKRKLCLTRPSHDPRPPPVRPGPGMGWFKGARKEIGQEEN